MESGWKILLAAGTYGTHSRGRASMLAASRSSNIHGNKGVQQRVRPVYRFCMWGILASRWYQRGASRTTHLHLHAHGYWSYSVKNQVISRTNIGGCTLCMVTKDLLSNVQKPQSKSVNQPIHKPRQLANQPAIQSTLSQMHNMKWGLRVVSSTLFPNVPQAEEIRNAQAQGKLQYCSGTMLAAVLLQNSTNPSTKDSMQVPICDST